MIQMCAEGRRIESKFLWPKRSTTQKMKFSIKDFFGKCDQIRSFLPIWSHILKNSLMKNLILYGVKQNDSIQNFTQIVNQFILPSGNWYWNFHIIFMCHALYFPLCTFTLCFPSIPFLYIDRTQKQMQLIKWFCLHKRLTIVN